MSFSFAESEYSPEAEAAYAEFVATGATGEEAFQELCARHEDLADELEGLHGDFAGVAGVLRRMGEVPPEPQASRRSAEVEMEGSAPPPASRRGLQASIGVLALALVGLGGWAYLDQQQSLREHETLSTQLAEESRRSSEESERARRAEERAEEEASVRALVEEEAARSLAQVEQARSEAEAARLQAELAAHAGRIARVQALLDRGRLEAAESMLLQVDAGHRGWEYSHLEHRLAETRHAAAAGRRLLEAAFGPFGEKRTSEATATAEAPAEDPVPVDTGELEFHRTSEAELDGIQRRFELDGVWVRVFDPRFEEPLLEFQLPRKGEGLAFAGGLWIRFPGEEARRWR